MAKVELKNITKRFKKVIALDDVSIKIMDNEFLVIFGPAGAGKTTLLNIIAGITDPELGIVEFDDKVMNCIESTNRNVAMVFENYALYPHMSAYDNIASPLRTRRYKKDPETIDKEVNRIAKMLNIQELLERLPSQVSNGQKQRIALGRALVRDPNVFLMDEPLAHLDAKLRHAMRKELKSMQESLNTTTVYVTHDYTEAMSLGDRIVVLNEGEIQQIGTPDEIYYTPANEFVASLFGETAINFINVSIVKDKDEVMILYPWECVSTKVPYDVVEKMTLDGIPTSADLGVRGVNMSYALAEVDKSYIRGKVYSLEPVGNKTELIVSINDFLVRLVAPVNNELRIDDEIYVSFDINNAIFFDSETKKYIGRHMEQELIVR